MKKHILGILGLVLVGVTYLLGADPESTGLVIAAFGGMYNTDDQHYRKLLRKKMEYVVWNLPVWSQFMGVQDTSRNQKVHKFGTPSGFKPSGKPIEVIKDFMHNGRVNMDIPVMYPLTNNAIYGMKQLLGNEETRRWANKTISINQVRQGVKSQDNKYSKQTLANPEFVKELMLSNTTYLSDWFKRWQSAQPGLAYVQGYSENLVDTVANGGLAITRKSHMNTYVAGSGRVTFSATHATYEASVNAAMDGLTDTSSDHFSTTVIENMVYVASHNHRIQPNANGYYTIVISDAAALQLQGDTKWQAVQRSAFQSAGQKHPELMGKVVGYYQKAEIVVDETLPSCYVNGDGAFTTARSTTSSTAGVSYGLSDFLATPVDTGPRKPAILIGSSSMACGVASEINFETEDYDYKQDLRDGADMIIGYEICDIVDADGKFTTAGNRYENVSSLVCWTYSPSSAAWT